ncbi:MAG: electron transfer flavoprotein subunit beta/FixA family protein [Chloroflexi bacterium]|nr:electron transfer flavoprotein subunit beta/FixA family protein [Chloroflexota bacterium]
MNILVCIKRVPATGGKITLTPDAQEIDARMLGFTISPHEECAVEEAVRLVEKHGGAATVLTLGPNGATEQLRDAMSIGVERAIHLETDGREFDPIATTNAIVNAIRGDGTNYDVLLFGNEAADTGDFQVGVRVAYAFGYPCVTGIKELAVNGNKVTAKREVPGGWEIFEVLMPAVITVKEGINLPRYPSLPGRLKAKKKPIATSQPAWQDGGLEKIKLMTPPEEAHQVEILGKGAEAAPKVVDLLERLGLL